MFVQVFSLKDVETDLVTDAQFITALALGVKIPRSEEKWWIKTPADTALFSRFIDEENVMWKRGEYNSAKLGVRPVFLTNTDVIPGKKVFVENVQCTALDERCVLSDAVLAKHIFNYTGCYDFGSTEIARFIKSEEFKNLIKEREMI